jgi:hypothetical protein
MRTIFLMTVFAAAMMAADATGTWTGTLTKVPSQEPGPAHLVLKQDGAKLTGTAGPDEARQHPIENGKVENGAITFELPSAESVMKFTLRQEGEEIKGDVAREKDGEIEKAALSVKRAK